MMRILQIWLVSRLFLFGVGLGTLKFLPIVPGLHYRERPWLEMWSHFDADWYLQIAARGYSPGFLGTPGYFPGYPWLVRAFSSLTRVDTLLAGVITSQLMFLLGLFCLYRLLLPELGGPRSQRVLWLVAAFPSAFFFSLAYSESTFLAFSCASLWAARRGYWRWAAVLAAYTALTRLVGLVLAPLLLGEAYRAGRFRWSYLLWLSLIPLGVALFFLHLQQRVGTFWAYFIVQSQYAHRLGVGAAVRGGLALTPAHWLGLSFLLAAVALMVRGWREWPWSWRGYATLSVLIPFVHTQGLCQHRFMLVNFPLFTALERWLEGFRFRLALWLFWGLQGWLFSLWVRGVSSVY